MHVVAVLFDLVPDRKDEFRAAVLENASRSLALEEGCHRFDVAFSSDGLRCFLYELYSDRAAFDEHLRTSHFARFNASTGEMIAHKRVESYQLIGSQGFPVVNGP